MTLIGNHLVFSYKVLFVRQEKKKICKLVSIHVAFGFVDGFSFGVLLVCFWLQSPEQ